MRVSVERSSPAPRERNKQLHAARIIPNAPRNALTLEVSIVGGQGGAARRAFEPIPVGPRRIDVPPNAGQPVLDKVECDLPI